MCGGIGANCPISWPASNRGRPTVAEIGRHRGRGAILGVVALLYERPRRAMLRAPGAAAGLALLASGARARADLSGDAERLVRLWTLRGARVERLAPMFLEHGRSRAVAVAPEPPAQAIAAGAVDPGAGCVTVAF